MPDSVDQLAARLLSSSAKNSYDPELDIDWAAPVDDFPDAPFLPFEHVSLYGTALWDGLSHRQRIELSKHELASVASTGLWFEIVLMHLLARYAYDEDPQAPSTQYALTEIGDETRHVIMFAHAVARMGVPTYRPARLIHNLARVYKATARGTAMFAPILLAEEITDRLQRLTMNDESIHPLVRMVNRIHVVEEARHVRFARAEVAARAGRSGPLVRLLSNTVAAVVGAVIADALIHPDVYVAVGLDPRTARRAARENPHHQRSRRFLAARIMSFLAEQGMVRGPARVIYRRAHLI
jgi:hypothetical protein